MAQFNPDLMTPDAAWEVRLQQAITTAIASHANTKANWEAANAKQTVEVYKAEGCQFFGNPVTIRVVIEPVIPRPKHMFMVRFEAPVGFWGDVIKCQDRTDSEEAMIRRVEQTVREGNRLPADRELKLFDCSLVDGC